MVPNCYSRNPHGRVFSLLAPPDGVWPKDVIDASPPWHLRQKLIAVIFVCGPLVMLLKAKGLPAHCILPKLRVGHTNSCSHTHNTHSLVMPGFCRGTRLVVHSMTPTASANIHRSSHRPRCVSDTRQPIDECFEVWPVNHHDWQCVGRKNFVQQWIDQG